MKQDILKALKASIVHWERIAEGKEGSRASYNCPLCKLLNEECGDCPVALKTGKCGCEGTPYYKFGSIGEDKYTEPKWLGMFAVSREAKLAALEEVKFLKSLLPKKGVKKVKK
jgi:hypothetical protein